MSNSFLTGMNAGLLFEKTAAAAGPVDEHEELEGDLEKLADKAYQAKREARAREIGERLSAERLAGKWKKLTRAGKAGAALAAAVPVGAGIAYGAKKLQNKKLPDRAKKASTLMGKLEEKTAGNVLGAMKKALPKVREALPKVRATPAPTPTPAVDPKTRIRDAAARISAAVK